MTAPRILVVGATTAITRRTTMRKAFVGPWHPGVSQAWLFAMALAQKETGVAVHHGTLVINHEHLNVTPEKQNLPTFTRMLHGETSSAINHLLGRERYDQPGDLFDGRGSHLMRLCDAAAQGSHNVYEYVNCVAAGLVDRPEHMPGHVFNFDLWLRGYIDIRRPDFYFSDTLPETLRLYVTPPPLLFAAFDGDMQALVHHMNRMANDAARELRAARTRETLGARNLQRMHPWSEPSTLRERGGEVIPTFRIGARGVVGRQQHIEAALETQSFRRDYRESLNSRRGGAIDTVFPHGTYLMHAFHNAPVQAPPEVGIVTRPGPLLCDIQAELDAERDAGRPRDPERKRRRFALVDEVREVFRDEASEICEHASSCMDFETRRGGKTIAVGDNLKAAHTDGTNATDQAADDDRPVVVRHRFDKRRQADFDTRRIVTLRDRRMGRRPKTRHGSDPPA